MYFCQKINEYYEQGDYQKIVDYLFPAKYLRLSDEEVEFTLNLLGKIPEETAKNTIEICAVMSYLNWDIGNMEEGERWLNHALNIRDSAREDSELRSEYSTVVSLIGIKNPKKDNSYLMLALSILYNEFLRNGKAFKSMTSTNGTPSVLRGAKDLSDWVENYRAVRSILTPILSSIFKNEARGIINAGVSEILYEKNKLSEASMETAIALISSDPEIIFVSRAVLAKVNRLDNAGMSVDEILSEIEREIDTEENRYLWDNYKAFKVVLEMEKGNLEEVSKWLETSGCKIGTYNMRLIYRNIATAKAYIALEKYRDAIIMLEGLGDMLNKINRPADLAESLVNTAVAFDKMGSKELADEKFEKAIYITKPYGYLRMYGDLGNGILPLVERFMEKNPNNFYIKDIYNCAIDFANKYPKMYDKNGITPKEEQERKEREEKEKKEKESKEILMNKVETLTQSEMDILRLLDDGKTNNEIAETMSIKLPTVKFHVKNIMEKLGAKNRTQAIKIARDLNYIS